MGKRRRNRNSTYRKQFHEKLNEHWGKDSKVRMRMLLGVDTEVPEVEAKIDGRDWRTFFPQPTKFSGFSWFEFARRVKKLNNEKHEEIVREAKNKAHQRFSEAHPSHQVSGSSENAKKHEDVVKDKTSAGKSIINPYKTQHTTNTAQQEDNNDSDDEKW
ncbi:hypothetical protein RFI_22045 [Reticulomyxa filosa]|uniref:Uncharacterized protein n=1 Tax=Reticulomyxa filosa TaxID=46433 RepID=X6MN81_RETFI|nr:hypothetical protein RFI_22045 [Reticulomyxa filosa]|eukprot:ETO15319.1 hypothetical protein RFI_22045 [Reticulomyxa filosa]